MERNDGMDTDESSRLHTAPDSPSSQSSETHSNVPKLNVETVENDTTKMPGNKDSRQSAETSKTTNSKKDRNKTGESSAVAGQNLSTPSDPRLKRASSLKFEKESDDPSCKKIVRFADALGLDLADVRVFADDDVSKVPTSAFSDLKLKSNNSSDFWSMASGKCCKYPSGSGTQEYFFVPQFAQPGADAYFLERVKRQKVCLENVMIHGLKVNGLVRILNMSFEKVVLAKYTTDDWVTQSEVLATYVPNSSDGLTDKFGFTIDQASPETKLIFVLKYEVNNEVFWDNNNCQNYTLVCKSRKNEHHNSKT